MSSLVIDIKAIFRDFRDPHSTKPHPTEAIKTHSKKLSRDVYAKYELLRCMVFRDYDNLFTIWEEKNAEERLQLLEKVWPQMPNLHRPEAFTEGGKSIEEYIGKVPPNRYMLPYLNKQDIFQDTSLLMLIDCRSRYPPHTFAMQELAFSPPWPY